MDTKLKKFKENMVIKAVAFILCVTCFISCLMMGFYMARDISGARSSYWNFEEVLNSTNYKGSVMFQDDLSTNVSLVHNLMMRYKSKEYILSGRALDSYEMENQMRDLYYQNEKDYLAQKTESQYENISFENPKTRKQFEKDFAQEIEAKKQELVRGQYSEFKRAKGDLLKIKGFSYFISDGTYAISSLGDDIQSADPGWFTSKPGYLIYEKGNLEKIPKSPRSLSQIDDWIQEQLESPFNKNLTVYMSFDDRYFADKEVRFIARKESLERCIPPIAISFVIGLFTLLYLIIAVGRRDEKGNIILRKTDKWFTEVNLSIVGISLLFGGGNYVHYLWNAMGNIGDYHQIFWGDVAAAMLIGAVSAGIGLYFLLSLVKTLKAGTFIKGSLLYKLFTAIVNVIKDIYHGGSPMRKTIIVVLAVSLVSGATFFFSPIVAIVAIIILSRWVKRYEEVKKGVKEIRQGTLNYQIPVSGKGEFDDLARDINEISKGFDVAVQNELKNQRLKTDLISNVSHDIKTPLTSIITYVDLLKEEGLDSVDAPKYLGILDQKSQRLKTLTEDLFEAAKASSGAINVNFERVELLSLIHQGLGEMNCKIEESGLAFKINAEKEKYYVRADGQLLWRVIENLLSNVLKYALPNSRVYIDVKQHGRHVVFEMKNISKDPLNIPSDELMERFKRGEESRNTEGSGLGLAIAKDLVRIQEGAFEIKIDGDLFKVTMLLGGDTSKGESVQRQMEKGASEEN